MITFNFNGLNSYKDLKILTTKNPIIPLNKRRVNKITIPGRDGELHDDEGTYEGSSIPVECAVNETSKERLVELISNIKAWLACGESDLVFDNQPDVIYRARIVNQIDFTNAIMQLGEFIIIFECQPFTKLNDTADITLTSSGTVVNIGTYKSLPIIKVYGTGTIVLYIGSQQVTLNNVVGYVTIDSVLVDCYKDTALKNNDMIGEFPVLEVGANNISWTGTVTKIEITPNFRNI